MKDIEKLLSENASAVLPGDKVKDSIKRELGINESAPSLAYAHGGTHADPGRKKKTAIIICAAALAVIISLSVALPIALGGSRTITPPLPGGNKFAEITDADSFYAYGAASVGTILSAADNTAIASSSAVVTSSAVSRSTELLDRRGDRDDDDNDDDNHWFGGYDPSFGDTTDVTDTVTRYMSLVESLLGEGGITEVVYENAEGYDYSMSISYTDLLGGTVSYTMSYNKTFIGGEYDDGETEENYAINGVLNVEGVEYPVEGMYETESEENESENEMYFKAYLSDDRRSYIEVEREYESETEDGENEIEQEYVYSVVENGRLVEQTTVEYESEEGELELKMTITAGGRTETLVFEDESERGQRILKVAGNIGGQKVSFKVYIRDGEYHYVFDDGHEEDHERDYHRRDD